MKIHHILIAGALLAPAALPAQDLKGSVEVEGTYTPEIIRQERITVLPAPPQIEIARTSLQYDTDGRVADYAPYLTPMVATEWGASRSLFDNRGYVHAGMGSYLNSNLSAGYRFVDTQRSTLGAWLQFNSTSLSRPETETPPPSPYRRRYDGRVGIYGSHLFDGHGRLSASASYALGYFNYFSALPSGADLKAPYQTVNEADVRLRWDSQNESVLRWNARAGVHHLGFREFYFPDKTRGFASIPGQRETAVNLGASLHMPWESGSRIGIDADLDMLLYGGADDVKRFDIAPEIDDYANLTLTPYYGFRRGLLNVRLGADIDLTFNAGPDGSRYHLFHIAPDIRFDWAKNGFGFFLHLLGGTELQTLQSLRDLDYYMMPALVSTRPVYSPIDARAGFNVGPFAGFDAAFSVAYKISNHTRLGGWYPYYLSQYSAYAPEWSLADLPGGLLNPDNDLTLKGWNLRLDLRYKYGRTLEASFAGTYQHQRNGHGYFNGFDRPQFTIDARLLVRPINPLAISLEYNLRALRKFYYHKTVSLTPSVPGGQIVVSNFAPELHSLSVPNFSELALRAEYTFSPAFSLWVRADNLLGRSNVLIPGLCSEKIAVMGGFAWKF